MSTGSAIEWTEATWNPVTGCTRVSAGCDHCYAVQMTHRLEGMGQEKYGGLTVLNNKGDRHFNGKVRCHEDALTIPLKWKKPRRIFVNSMSDLFHKEVPFEFIDKVFAVMALCPQHTFQILTKRPERMAEYLLRRPEEDEGWLEGAAAKHGIEDVIENWEHGGNETLNLMKVWSEADGLMPAIYLRGKSKLLPLPNVWLGTSCENQSAADERIPHLLRCPAAVRFISAEPLLGAISFRWAKWHNYETQVRERRASGARVLASHLDGMEGIHWVIVGGESGKGARPCEIAWIRNIIDQCKSAGVPCFVKQLGSKVRAHVTGDDGFDWPAGTMLRTDPVTDDGLATFALRDSKGGDISEWPEDLRVREYPTELAKA